MDTTNRRRLLVGTLWFLAGWVWVGAAITVLSLPALITPLGAVAVGALAAWLYRRQPARAAAIAGNLRTVAPPD